MSYHPIKGHAYLEVRKLVEKAIYCRITIIWHSRKGKNIETRKCSESARDLGAWRKSWVDEVFFRWWNYSIWYCQLWICDIMHLLKSFEVYSIKTKPNVCQFKKNYLREQKFWKWNTDCNKRICPYFKHIKQHYWECLGVKVLTLITLDMSGFWKMKGKNNWIWTLYHNS